MSAIKTGPPPARLDLSILDGQEFIDGLSGVFVASLGHGERAVIDAITAQLNRLAFAPPLHGTSSYASGTMWC